jgi:hypothetical protein
MYSMSSSMSEWVMRKFFWQNLRGFKGEIWCVNQNICILRLLWDSKVSFPFSNITWFFHSWKSFVVDQCEHKLGTIPLNRSCANGTRSTSMISAARLSFPHPTKQQTERFTLALWVAVSEEWFVGTELNLGRWVRNNLIYKFRGSEKKIKFHWKPEVDLDIQ